MIADGSCLWRVVAVVHASRILLSRIIVWQRQQAAIPDCDARRTITCILCHLSALCLHREPCMCSGADPLQPRSPGATSPMACAGYVILTAYSVRILIRQLSRPPLSPAATTTHDKSIALHVGNCLSCSSLLRGRVRASRLGKLGFALFGLARLNRRGQGPWSAESCSGVENRAGHGACWEGTGSRAVFYLHMTDDSPSPKRCTVIPMSRVSRMATAILLALETVIDNWCHKNLGMLFGLCTSCFSYPPCRTVLPITTLLRPRRRPPPPRKRLRTRPRCPRRPRAAGS